MKFRFYEAIIDCLIVIVSFALAGVFVIAASYYQMAMLFNISRVFLVGGALGIVFGVVYAVKAIRAIIYA